MHRYRIDIQWSEEDAVWIARVPEVPMIAAHGDTPEEAAREVTIALDAAIDAMLEAGIAVPVPGAAAHAA